MMIKNKPAKLLKIAMMILIGSLLFSLSISSIIAQIDKSISAYQPIISETKQLIPVYRYDPVDVPYSCYDGVSKNVTCYQRTDIKVLDHMKNTVIESKIIGYQKGDIRVIGIVNEEKGIISKWAYPIGDRNMDEFGRCIEYEIEKGVCDEYY